MSIGIMSTSLPPYLKCLVYWGYILKIIKVLFHHEKRIFIAVHPKHLIERGEVEWEDWDLLKVKYKKEEKNGDKS